SQVVERRSPSGAPALGRRAAATRSAAAAAHAEESFPGSRRAGLAAEKITAFVLRRRAGVGAGARCRSTLRGAGKNLRMGPGMARKLLKFKKILLILESLDAAGAHP